MKPIFVIAAAALLVACAGPRHGHGGPGGPGGPGRHGPRAMDDGVPPAQCLLKPLMGPGGALTRAELDAGVARIFATADRSGDGWLDQSETRVLNEQRRTSCDRTPVIDYSGTGRVDRRAFGARYVTTFTEADRDANGTLTADELKAALRPRQLPPEREPNMRPDDRRPVP